MSASNPLGINLSFCVKRWITPQLWAPVVRDSLGLDKIQFSFDLVDPMWPSAVVSRHAKDVRNAAADYGIVIHSAFIGLAHYTFNQLLHPDEEVRTYAEHWLERAYDFAAEADIPAVGGPLGAIASRPDGTEADAIDERDYDSLIERMMRLGQKAKVAGLSALYVEPTPMRRGMAVDHHASAADDDRCGRQRHTLDLLRRLGPRYHLTALWPAGRHDGAMACRAAGRDFRCSYPADRLHSGPALGLH